MLRFNYMQIQSDDSSICILYYLSMKGMRSKTSNNNMIFYQKEEPVQQVGCCFTTAHFDQPDSQNLRPQRYRVHSEPKQSKNQKIGLVIAKRGHSHSKESENNLRTQSKEKVTFNPNKMNKDREQPRMTLTINSKLTTQGNSLKNSKVSFNREYKVERMVTEQKRSHITTTNTVKPQTDRHLTTHQDLTSISFISQIPVVKEEFVSLGSQTLQTLNFITQLQLPDNLSKKTQETTYYCPSQLGSSIFNPNKETTNGMKITDVRKCGTLSAKKRLVL